MLLAHNLGDYGHTRFRLGFLKQAESVYAHSLKRIRRGTRLKRSASQQRRARIFNRSCHLYYLLFALDRAGTGNNLKMSASEFVSAYVHYSVVRMKFAVCVFIRLLNASYALYNVERADKVDIYL